MNKPVIMSLAALLLSSCGFGGGDVTIEAADIEDYIDWKEDQTEDKIEPFKAKPIAVSGTGTVRAVPDIAVLTGLIKTEAKVDYKAMDAASEIVNRVQEIIDGKPVDMSFTNLSAVEKRDEDCLAHNRIASRRNSDINSDNWFNKNELNRREDVRQKLRPPKSRIAQKVCEVTHVENYISFTAWVRPSGAVSEYIRAFTEAGVERVDLFGFDFSNYDALYKEASEKAVANAREKAEISARIAGTKLTTIESFSVSGTARRSRFGPQATIISPHGDRSVTPQQRTTFADRVIRSQASPRNRRSAPVYAPPPPVPQASVSCWDGSLVFNTAQCPGEPALAVSPVSSYTGAATSRGFSGVSQQSSTGPVYETVTEQVVVQEASVEYVSIPPTFETVNETVVVQEAFGNTPAVTKQISRRVVKTPARTVERIIPAVTKQETRRVLKNRGAVGGGGGVSTQAGASNALNESILSGSKTIRVTASLSYNYETPLDGVIFKVPEED